MSTKDEPLIQALLVYDGGEQVRVPPSMGEPRSDQLIGTVREVVTELCGRICYDSLGGGRNSADYHRHIKDVNHLSVVEHTPVNVQLVNHTGGQYKALVALANRPGVSFRLESSHAVRVTVDFRAALEWDKWTPEWLRHIDASDTAGDVGRVLCAACSRAAPMIVPFPEGVEADGGGAFSSGYTTGTVVEPRYPEEQWASVFMSCSRGASLEQIRHDWMTAYALPRDADVGISQRSTRYVDESESPYVPHPLMVAGLEGRISGDQEMVTAWDNAEEGSKVSYRILAARLQQFLEGKGVPRPNARKQARGAARGVLGNALLTQFVFSASVKQWAHMLRLRASDAADAEIRMLYAGNGEADYPSVFRALGESRYAGYFAERFFPKASTDGIGQCLEYTGE